MCYHQVEWQCLEISMICKNPQKNELITMYLSSFFVVSKMYLLFERNDLTLEIIIQYLTVRFKGLPKVHANMMQTQLISAIYF